MSVESQCVPDGAVNGGCLLVVGTPIGNLGDLTPRAAASFAQADAICCEDTRVTSKLLNRLEISRPLIRCDENVISQRALEIVDRIEDGETIAFASDAGMPSVSDPGQVLVDAVRGAGLRVEVIPGPSACVTALVSSGIACDQFFFEGFLPRKHGDRVRRLRRLAGIPGALLFYESPHRVVDSLVAIAEVFPGRMVALCRELTKMHEEVLRDVAPALLDTVRGRGELKGEMVLVVAPPSEEELEMHEVAAAAGGLASGGETDFDALLRADIKEALVQGEPASAVAKRLSQKYSRKKREVYEMVVSAQSEVNS